MQKGKIGVTTENIFPIIKKFLYSDHEIFLRELVSNAIDASQKLRTLSSFGDFKGELGELKVEVTVDDKAGTLTVTDHGIGMDAEEVEKYINQIALSGAEDFLAKYKDTANNIIGHFGLGFYSAFMVAKKVEIRTLSYKEGAKAVKWICDGSPEYSMEDCDKATRGTEVILYIDDDDKQFLQTTTINSLLRKYCRFLPLPVSGPDGQVLNATQPLWTRKPADLTDKDYRELFAELYPGEAEPLFWIHLNVDYPFNLTGILYFPKIKPDLKVNTERIQLYCNQVYVTDQVEGVVPEFMTLLKGVIDSPDIPLNVSRSYLQADNAVKKISSYITKKVAQRLEELSREQKEDFEKKWDDIKIFIQYGMLTDEKFRDEAMKFYLLKDVEGHAYTLKEYRTLIEATQTDNKGNVVYIYATDPVAQYSYIQGAKDMGYSVLVMDSPLVSHVISMFEQALEKAQFVRVDSTIPSKLVPKDTKSNSSLTPGQIALLTTVFEAARPKTDKAMFNIEFDDSGEAAAPVVVVQGEFSRRMKDMMATQAGMDFLSSMPASYNIVVNTASPFVLSVLKNAETAIGEESNKIQEQIDADNKAITEEKDEKAKDALLEKVQRTREEASKLGKNFCEGHPEVSQSLDIALLATGILKGEELSKFIARSFKLLS